MRIKPRALRKRRLELGLTQAELAAKIGVTGQVVSYWERGQWGMSRDNEAKLHKIFKATR